MFNRKRSRRQSTTRPTKKHKPLHTAGGIECWHTQYFHEDCGACNISSADAKYGVCFDDGYCNPTQCVAICKSTGNRCRRYSTRPNTWFSTCSETSHVSQVPLQLLKTYTHFSASLSIRYNKMAFMCDRKVIAPTIHRDEHDNTPMTADDGSDLLLHAKVTGVIKMKFGTAFSLKPSSITIESDYIRCATETPTTVWTVVFWNTGIVEIGAKHFKQVSDDAYNFTPILHTQKMCNDSMMVSILNTLIVEFEKNLQRQIKAWKKLSKTRINKLKAVLIKQVDTLLTRVNKWEVICVSIVNTASYRATHDYQDNAMVRSRLSSLNELINTEFRPLLFHADGALRQWKILFTNTRKPLSNIMHKLRTHVSHQIDNTTNMVRGQRGDQNHDSWLGYN